MTHQYHLAVNFWWYPMAQPRMLTLDAKCMLVHTIILLCPWPWGWPIEPRSKSWGWWPQRRQQQSWPCCCCLSSGCPCAFCQVCNPKVCGQSTPYGARTNWKCTCPLLSFSFHRPWVALSSTPHLSLGTSRLKSPFCSWASCPSHLCCPLSCPWQCH